MVRLNHLREIDVYIPTTTVAVMACLDPSEKPRLPCCSGPVTAPCGSEFGEVEAVMAGPH